MFIIIFRIILVWWLLTAVFRFIDRYMAEQRAQAGVQGADNTPGTAANLDSIDDYASAIEDADFEEIDNR